MYYRVAMRRQADQGEGPPLWQWKSLVLSSLQDLFQVLRLYHGVGEQLDQLRVFSCSSREGLAEQLVRENQGVGSPSVTATHFLHERRIHFPERTPATPAREAGAGQPMASLAAATHPSAKESSRQAPSLDERDGGSLEKRRLEFEPGPGGDHDLLYRFTLPTSLPQVLSWVKLLARVQQGDFQPEVGAIGSGNSSTATPLGPSTPTYASSGKNLPRCAARSDKE
jgi:hypothetical protein